MSPSTFELAAIFVLALLIAVLFGGVALLLRLIVRRITAPARRSQGSAERQHDAPQGAPSLPYALTPNLLTPAEREFFAALLQAAPSHLRVFAQVRLANLVHTTERRPKQRQYDFYRIQAKCVDFVLCDAATAPRLVVELDDSSHQQARRQQRDAFVDAALAAAGLPVLHVRWQPRYDPLLLAAQINAALDRAPIPDRLSAVEPAPPMVASPSPARSAPAERLADRSRHPPDAPAQRLAPAAVPAVAATAPRYACGQCHREVRREAAHCPHCGARLEAAG